MTQKPVGEVILVNAGGQHEIGYDAHDLYSRSIELFGDAIAACRPLPTASTA